MNEDRVMTDAGVARAAGWTVGTRLVGDEGYGPATIELTAIGRDHVLAVWSGRDEALTCLTARKWSACICPPCETTPGCPLHDPGVQA